MVILILTGIGMILCIRPIMYVLELLYAIFVPKVIQKEVGKTVERGWGRFIFGGTSTYIPPKTEEQHLEAYLKKQYASKEFKEYEEEKQKKEEYLKNNP